MSLPIFQSDSSSLTNLQTQWSTILNPVIIKPLNSGVILTQVSLKFGPTTVNHLLGRKLQGWFIVRQRSLASIYDNQDSNQQAATTLLLFSSAPVVVDIFVF